MKYEQLTSMHTGESISKQGFLLVEVVLAVAIFALLITGFAGVYLYGQEATVHSGDRSRAVLLAQEGLEAVRNLRDDDFANLIDGTHGIATSSNTWTLSGASDVTDIFTRAITISAVDASRKDVTATVSWQQNATRNSSVTLATRLTNWVEIITSGVGDWSNASTTAIIDISGANNGWKVATAGDYAYVVRNGGNPDFLVIDVSDPDNPSIADSMNVSGNPRNVAVSGDYVYIVGNSNSQELQIMDVSTPTAVTEVGSYNAPGNNDMYGVYAVGTTVYMSRDSSSQDEFYIVNATVPAAPVLVGSEELGSDANEVYVSGNYAYVASDDNSEELQIIDISVPALPNHVASLNLSTNDNAESIDGYSSTVVVGRSTNDGFVHIIDVSTPTSPSQLGSYTAGDDVRDVTIGNSGNYIFIGTDANTGEFQVIDATTPATPATLESLNVNRDINGVVYSTEHDRVFAVGEGNDEEFIVFAPQ